MQNLSIFSNFASYGDTVTATEKSMLSTFAGTGLEVLVHFTYQVKNTFKVIFLGNLEKHFTIQILSEHFDINLLFILL